MSVLIKNYNKILASLSNFLATFDGVYNEKMLWEQI